MLTEVLLILENNNIFEIFFSSLGSAVSLDTEHCSILLLLDLSAALDTINYNVLINRLNQYVGILGTA